MSVMVGTTVGGKIRWGKKDKDRARGRERGEREMKLLFNQWKEAGRGAYCNPIYDRAHGARADPDGGIEWASAHADTNPA